MSIECPEKKNSFLPKEGESSLPIDVVIAVERNKALERTREIFKLARELSKMLNEGNAKIEPLLEAFTEKIAEKDELSRRKIEEGDLEAANKAIEEIKEATKGIINALRMMESAIQNFLFESSQIALGHRDKEINNIKD